MYYTALPERGLILVSGEGRETFLQGLISNDIYKLKSQPTIYAALLTPQGKFLHDFFLTHYHGGILIDCEKSRMADLLQRLSLYKLRSKVAFETPDTICVTAAWGEKTDRGFADPRLPQMGYRILGEKKTIDAWQPATPQDYDQMRLALGVPDGSRDMIVDKNFLLECHFEALHGVDFNKGCYVGQEVTARSKFRGQVRKFLYQVRAQNGELPEPTTPVYLGDVVVGEMRSHSGGQGLAMLRADDVAKVSNVLSLRAGEKNITAALPAWAAQ